MPYRESPPRREYPRRFEFLTSVSTISFSASTSLPTFPLLFGHALNHTFLFDNQATSMSPSCLATA